MRINTKLRNLCRALLREEGSAMIEMALVLPAFMLIVMGIIEFGIIFHIQSIMNYAANEAARQGKTGNTYGSSGTREELTLKTIQDRVGTWVYNPGDLSVAQKSYGSFAALSSGAGAVSGAGSGGQIVLYTVTLNWKVLTPVFAQLVGEVVPITARVLVRNENF